MVSLLSLLQNENLKLSYIGLGDHKYVCLPSGYGQSEFTFPRLKTLNTNKHLTNYIYKDSANKSHFSYCDLSHDPAQEKQLLLCHRNKTQRGISLSLFLTALEYHYLLVIVQMFFMFPQFCSCPTI